MPRKVPLFFLVAVSLSFSASFTLVDGEKCATIVVPDNTVVSRKPAELLQKMVERSTGRKLAIVPEKEYQPLSGSPAIFVGRTDRGLSLFGKRLAGLDRDSYLVAVKPGETFLIGASDYSCLWAVGDFLREYLGIDSYFPADCGLVVPRHSRVVIPTGIRVEEPAFKSRAFSALNTNRGLRSLPEMPWRLHSGHGRYAFHHNLHSFITVEEFGQTHPEYFPFRDGRRQIVSSSAAASPCLSNPEVVRIVIDKCRKYFDTHPEAESISLGMTDGGWCECESCRALDSPSITVAGRQTPRSGRYYHFVNQVAAAIAQSHPGKFVGVLGYAGAEFPPAFRVERNIIPYLCYSRANWYNPEARKLDLEVTKAWLERVDRIGVYEYLYGAPYSVPRLYTRHLAEFLRFVASRCPGSGFYAEIYANHGLDGPKAWLTEKLLWNPKQNPERLLRTWCQAVFQEAAGPMERYFRGLEDTWNRNGMKAGPSLGKLALYGDDKQLEIFAPEDVAARWKDIEAARRLARSEEVRERIEYFASTFRITELTVQQYHAYKRARQLLAEGADGKTLLAALIEGDRKAPREDVKAYIEKIQKGDPTKFLGGVEIKSGAELSRQVVLKLAWSKVLAALQSGEREAGRLKVLAQEAIKGAAGDWQDEVACRRLEELLSMAGRITVARRVSQPPEIDGQANEAAWQWHEDRPWFAWKSGQVSQLKTEYSFLWDENFLYIGFRCQQPDIAQQPSCQGYGAPAWKYPSVEIFLNPDASQAELADAINYQEAPVDRTRLMQVIIAHGGGLWERDQQAVAAYAASSDKNGWQAELKIAWSRLRFGPDRYRFLRLNMVRNVGTGGHTGIAWFPSTGAHASYESRGWLLFE
ncbi:MAG TPA: DUF4838 domain-containing protein [bacterium]|nr:DUF4838 domain-containing protein [bacterium]HOL67077.1 DUF4838 domain-containing protein [bacterium]HPP12045.1 DUF4838 domain-containing protein [bacterium]